MKEESLNRALDDFMVALDNDDVIDNFDKMEILLNIRNYLDPNTYRDNNVALEEARVKRKYIKAITKVNF